MSIVTALLWGVLPIILKISLQGFTIGTIAWFRFSLAFLLLGIILQFKGSRPLKILRKPPWMGIFGGLCLTANYYWVTLGVEISGPSNMAVLIQTASVFLFLTGVFVFRERLASRQILGMFVVATGLTLFFFDQQSRVTMSSDYYFADFLIIMAAIVWVGYMISQKFLSREYGAQSLNFLVYTVATVALWPQYFTCLRSLGRSREIYTSLPDQRYYFPQSIDHSCRNENFTCDGVRKFTTRPSWHGRLFWGSHCRYRRNTGCI